MAIETSNNWKYDEENDHFFYLTTVGGEKFTGYDLSTKWTDSDKRLYKQGRIFHEWLVNSAYNQKGKLKNHRDIIEWLIFKNENGEQAAVIRALTEFIEATWDSDWDRIMYEEDGSYKMPPSVVSIARNSGIKYLGEIFFTVPEDEYRVDY